MTSNRMKGLVLLLSFLVLAPSQVLAENKIGGITLSPASQEITLDQNQPEVGGVFTITNNNDEVATFELVSVDMGALDDTGGLIFSGLSQDYQKKYGLAEWLSLSRTSVVVNPKAKETVAFTIKDKESLSPGGHYGAIVVRRSDGPASSDQRIALSPQAASLLFLRKVGGERYGLSLEKVTSNHSTWQLPTKLSLRLKNDGNVHVVPRGIVQLKNSSGREIAKGVINPESALILPERMRTMSTTLESKPTLWPGRYTIEVAYRYDGDETFRYYHETFYTANLRIALLMGGGLIIIAALVYRVRKLILRYMRRFKGYFRLPHLR